MWSVGAICFYFKTRNYLHCTRRKARFPKMVSCFLIWTRGYKLVTCYRNSRVENATIAKPLPIPKARWRPGNFHWCEWKGAFYRYYLLEYPDCYSAVRNVYHLTEKKLLTAVTEIKIGVHFEMKLQRKINVSRYWSCRFNS